MNLKVPYQNFFIKDEAGKAFVTEIRRMIDSNHEKAEKELDESAAFAYAQRAKGNRELLDHILSATTDTKKGKSM